MINFVSFKVIQNPFLNMVPLTLKMTSKSVKYVSCNPELALTGKSHKNLLKVNFFIIYFSVCNFFLPKSQLLWWKIPNYSPNAISPNTPKNQWLFTLELIQKLITHHPLSTHVDHQVAQLTLSSIPHSSFHHNLPHHTPLYCMHSGHSCSFVADHSHLHIHYWYPHIDHIHPEVEEEGLSWEGTHYNPLLHMMLAKTLRPKTS